MKLEITGYCRVFADIEKPLDVYIARLRIDEPFYIYRIHISGPPYIGESSTTYFDGSFTSMEEALEKFNYICEHIEDFTKEAAE